MITSFSSKYSVMRNNLNTYYQENTKAISLFQEDETWISEGDGIIAADTTNFKIGSRSLRMTDNDNNIGDQIANRLVNVDISKFNNNSSSTTSDFINIYLYCTNPEKVNVAGRGIWFWLGSSDWSKYFKYEIKAGILSNWNMFSIPKSSFTKSGTTDADWANIQRIWCAFHSTANALNEYVSLQLLQLVKKDPIGNFPNPFQRNGVRDRVIMPGEHWYVGLDNGTLVYKDLAKV